MRLSTTDQAAVGVMLSPSTAEQKQAALDSLLQQSAVAHGQQCEECGSAARDAEALGLTIFSYIGGTGVLRVSSVSGEHGNVAELDGHFDGGDD